MQLLKLRVIREGKIGLKIASSNINGSGDNAKEQGIQPTRDTAAMVEQLGKQVAQEVHK